MDALTTMMTTNTQVRELAGGQQGDGEAPRIRLNSVSVFSRTIEATLRLDAAGAEGPRSASRRAASSELSPRVLIPGAP